MDELPTIAALATPSGSSALAVIRVSGGLAYSIAGEVFKRKEVFPRRAYFGKYNSVDGKLLDECVWVVFSGPKSYTGEDLLEISCHGNPFIIKRILIKECSCIISRVSDRRLHWAFISFKTHYV